LRRLVHLADLLNDYEALCRRMAQLDMALGRLMRVRSPISNATKPGRTKATSTSRAVPVSGATASF
jgi:hypothetical protein